MDKNTEDQYQREIDRLYTELRWQKISFFITQILTIVLVKYLLS